VTLVKKLEYSIYFREMAGEREVKRPIYGQFRAMI